MAAQITGRQATHIQITGKVKNVFPVRLFFARRRFSGIKPRLGSSINFPLWLLFQCMRCWCPQTSSRCLGPWLSRWNGKAVNISEIARFLGVSRPTASARLLELERDGIVRLLPFMGAGGKSLLYLRHVYGSGPESYRGYCTDAVTERIQELFPESSFFWWKTGYVRRIDLLAVIGERRIGCEQRLVAVPRMRCTRADSPGIPSVSGQSSFLSRSHGERGARNGISVRGRRLDSEPMHTARSPGGQRANQ